jgi:SNF2 family DNA or RNA helicase
VLRLYSSVINYAGQCGPGKAGLYMAFNIKTKLFTHQRYAKKKTLENWGASGYALFVDMGLGKTLITLSVAAEKNIPLVIICPKAIMNTWLNEIQKHTEGANVFLWDNGKAKTKKYKTKFIHFIREQNNKIFIVNTEAFQILNKTLVQMIKYMVEKPGIIAVDESSFIKNDSANRTKNIIKAGELFRFRMILTGTEITKSILDLYSQFKFVNSSYWKKYGLSSFWKFKLHYAVLQDEYGTGGRIFKKVVGYQRQNELMDRIVCDYTRLKREDCLDLPEKQYDRVSLEMPQIMRAVYEKLKSDLFAEYAGKELDAINPAALFIRFRQISGGFFPYKEEGEAEIKPIAENTKLEFLLSDIADTDEKIIIWASFVPEIEAIAESLGKEYGGQSVITFYGKTPKAERKNAEEKFNNNQIARFFVGNPSTAGFGLNLQKACHIAYYYSLPLSAEHYWQSQDRIHRSGQKEKVLYKILEYKNCVDQRLYMLLENKTGIREAFRDMKIQDFFNIL